MPKHTPLKTSHTALAQKAYFIDVDTKQAFRAFVKDNLNRNQHITTNTKKIMDYANKTLISYLNKTLSNKYFKRILLFYPKPDESNILQLLKRLKKMRGKKIFLPTIESLNFKMLPYRMPLIKNKFNIFEPKLSHYIMQKVDVAVIPSLGIDTNFRRIGMGKGMYDRKFGKIKNQPYKIFTSQTLYITKSSITQDFDIQGDEYISYKYRVKKGKINVLDSNNKFSRFRSCGRVERLSSL